ncbi:MAG: ShlB/FhaC/HecB family hemolysin secretion/activation protein [Methylococcales bacterium]|nr:ShlB/FhaC/HecB family hemolysin secretion/activation protein [Methylococcales bacterium]
MQSITIKQCRKRSDLLASLLSTVLLGFSFQPCAQEAEQQAQQAEARPQETFDLFELRIKGNTVLGREDIERIVYPFLGTHKSINTVENARVALENLFHSKGYQTVMVDIPEQKVEHGIVYLHVGEGKVSRLRVKGSRYFSLGDIKDQVPALAEGSVPNMPVVQKELAALAKESPDRTVTPILRAGDTPGTLDVDLQVKDELPLHGKFEINGRNTYTTDRLRMIGTLRYDNLWQALHSASFMYQVSPENANQVEVMVGSYVMPVIDKDKRLAFFAVDSASNTVANAGALAVVGNGNIYGLRFVDPIITKMKNYFQTFSAGVSYKNFQQNLSGLNVTTLFRQTPISYLPFVVGYSGNLHQDDSSLAFNLDANFSVRGLGNTESQFANSRYKAQSDFAYLRGSLDYKHDLPYGMEIESRSNGQLADMPLIPNEQFSIGGMQSVRGYYETQVLADSGIQSSLELYSPKLDIQGWADYNKVRGLVFFDFGNGWMMNALSGSPSQYQLASAGTGFRMNLWKSLTANFDVAVPFVSQTRVESGNPRLHFQVFTEF